MGFFDKQIQFITDLENQLISLTDQSVEQVSEKIVEIVTENQLSIGYDGSGKQLAPYSKPYERIRINLNLQVQRTDLKVSGDFYASIFIDQLENGFQILSDGGEKVGGLINLYGFDILRPNITDLKELLKPQIAKNIKEYVKSRLTR